MLQSFILRPFFQSRRISRDRRRGREFHGIKQASLPRGPVFLGTARTSYDFFNAIGHSRTSFTSPIHCPCFDKVFKNSLIDDLRIKSIAKII
jgi:hypothetical protein